MGSSLLEVCSAAITGGDLTVFDVGLDATDLDGPGFDAIVFDFDGLILDTESTEFDAWDALHRRYAGSPLARHVWADCGRNRDALQAWCDRAGQFAYAQLAPAVFGYGTADPAAAELLGSAAKALEGIPLATDPR